MVKKTFIINGVTRNILVDENETLATFLRERLLLTGCKIGCGEGHCGACNVIVNGKVTRSCLTKLGKIKDGAEITTIEGIGTLSDLHPLQVAWMAHGCAQCGFCSPGFIMTSKVLLDNNPSPPVRTSVTGSRRTGTCAAAPVISLSLTLSWMPPVLCVAKSPRKI